MIFPFIYKKCFVLLPSTQLQNSCTPVPPGNWLLASLGLQGAAPKQHGVALDSLITLICNVDSPVAVLVRGFIRFSYIRVNTFLRYVEIKLRN